MSNDTPNVEDLSTPSSVENPETIKKAKLEGLVEHMNQAAENLRYAYEQTGNKTFELRAGGIQKFADELEEVIEDE